MSQNNAVYSYILENIQIEWVVKFFVLYFFVVWIAILVWVIRDITNRTDNVFLQLFAILSVLILTPLGIFIYLIIRPSKTLFEKYYDEVENNLSHLSDEVKDKVWLQNFKKISCFNCWVEVERDFKYCANCNIKLVKKCPKCSKDMNLEWKNCPYCWWEQKEENKANINPKKETKKQKHKQKK